MKIELAANPNAAYASEDGSAIDCDVLIDGAPHRFTASAADSEAHGRAIHAALTAPGGPAIAPFMPPPPPPPPPAAKPAKS